MIVIDTRGSLGNRMQAIDSASALAEKLGRSLLVPWSVNDR